MTNGELTVTLSAATAHLLTSTFEESKKRGEESTRYMKEPASFVEYLLDFAVTRKASEWKSRDQYNVGKSLRLALDKLVNHKPLNAEETKLVAAFQAAATPPAPSPAS